MVAIRPDLKPGKHTRKAIHGAAAAAVTAAVGAAKDGNFTFAEICGMVGATVLGYLVVWAGVNEPRPGTRRVE